MKPGKTKIREINWSKRKEKTRAYPRTYALTNVCVDADGQYYVTDANLEELEDPEQVDAIHQLQACREAEPTVQAVAAAASPATNNTAPASFLV